MPYSLLFFDEVLNDVEQAKEWYKTQRQGLEEEFALAVELAIQQLLKEPFAHAVRYRNVRIAHPKRFPYNIHFYIDESNLTVVITAIVHSKRDPLRFFNRKS